MFYFWLMPSFRHKGSCNVLSPWIGIIETWSSFPPVHLLEKSYQTIWFSGFSDAGSLQVEQTALVPKTPSAFPYISVDSLGPFKHLGLFAEFEPQGLGSWNLHLWILLNTAISRDLENAEWMTCCITFVILIKNIYNQPKVISVLSWRMRCLRNIWSLMYRVLQPVAWQEQD